MSTAPPAQKVRRLLERVSRATGASGEVSVLFCGDRRIRTLNRRDRGRDRATDVLAFPGASPPGDSPPLLGDIVVSVPYAERQARRLREPLSRELDRLLLHGFLHLAGYDHETDEGQMDALESKLRRRFGLGARA